MRAVGQPAGVRAESLRGSREGWDAVLVCLAAYILASVGRIHQLFPVLMPLKPALVSGALAVLLLLLDQSPQRQLRWVWGPATAYLLALVAWMALSVPGALWPAGAFRTWLDFAKTAVIYLVAVIAVRDVRDVERLALVYFLGAAAFAVVVLTRFNVGDEGRLAGLYYYDANDFATLAVIALPLGLYSGLSHTRRAMRLLAWAGIAALAVAFAWSGSRGGVLALFAVVTYVLVRYTAIPKRWRVASVAVIALLAAATASDSTWARMQTLANPGGDYNLTSDEGRIRLWQRGLGYMRQHPVFGVGAGNFPTAEGTISPLAQRQQYGMPVKWGPPHNSYVQIGAELGVPALLIFAGFLLSVFAALRARQPPAGGAPPQPDGPAATRLAQALTAALIGYVVGAFFLTLAYYEMLYMLAALAVALRKVCTPRGMPDVHGPRRGRTMMSST